MLWGACEALATPRPLGPLVDMAEEMKGPLLDALRSSRPPHELFQAFLNAVREHGGPTVIVLEDAHWIDDASADFLKFVARRIARYPALARGDLSRRGGDAPAPDDARNRRRAGRSPDAGAAARPLPVRRGRSSRSQHGRSMPNLYALSEGNPFLVTELVRSDEPAPSATLRGAVLSRLAQWDAKARCSRSSCR